MSKTLLVMRHAKSGWDNFDISDFDRPLKARGINDAIALAYAQKALLASVDKVVSSPANRAIHTAILICKTLGLDLECITLNMSLYEASVVAVERIVRDLPSSANSALIVGHNPSLTYFVNTFLANQIENLPTAGLVQFEFDCDHWCDIARENRISELIDFPNNH